MKRLLAAFLFASSPVVSLAAPAIGGLSAEESAVLRALIAKVDATAIQGSANPTLVGKTTLTYSGDQTYSMYGASRRCESGASPSPVPHRCGASPPPLATPRRNWCQRARLDICIVDVAPRIRTDHNGYDDAKARCGTAFPAPAAPSHVCTAHELSILAQTKGHLSLGEYWYIDLVRCARPAPHSPSSALHSRSVALHCSPLTHAHARRRHASTHAQSMTHWVDEGKNTSNLVQDCAGWSTDSPTEYGNCVDYNMLGGTVLPSICSCDRKLQFICCADYA